MKLIFENWRRFLKEADTVDDPPWRQTVREKPVGFHDLPTKREKQGLQPMDPRDVRTPVTTSKSETTAEDIPQVQLSGGILKHNANKLLSYFKDDSRTRNIFRKGWGKAGMNPPGEQNEFYQQAEQYINFLVANNPIFQKNKIVKDLGAGSFGFVVELDNSHALKVYVGSFDPIDRGTDPAAGSDIKRYRASQSKTFGGTASAGELHIYEEGEIETPLGRKWFYAEMPQIVTLSGEMRAAHGRKDDTEKEVRKITDGTDYEISFLKELAYVANAVDEHGAAAVIEDVQSPAQAQAWEELWNAEPGEPTTEPKTIVDMMKCCYTMDSKHGGDEPTEFAKIADLLEQGKIKDIFNMTGQTGKKKVFLLDHTFAENLLNQLKDLLKTKTLDDIQDVRGANVGFYPKKEKVPIIFDF